MEKNKSKEAGKAPIVILIRSYSGRPRSPEYYNNFVQGPMALAHKVLRSLPKEKIIEDAE
ncbi:MAG: hypothetical protein KGH94_02310 [Candidatus Micrarchaeota archaeon]|nr:hypothetical protein [Candidatus Micrarchaeota archaeon]